jgi:ElaB/YqjD/DUF883 family membrane-anchored ribosome-binding protein
MRPIMAKSNEDGGKATAGTGTFEGLGKKLDERPEIRAAEEAVRRAKQELDQAQRLCHELREQAGEKFKQFREQDAADVVECTLSFVRKHPGPGVLCAAFLGFFLGRLFRR